MSEEKQNQIVKTPIAANGNGLVLRSIEDMYRFGQYIVKCGLAKTPEEALIKIQTGAELGLSPMRSLQNVCVVNNQARIWGDVPLGLVQQSGKLQFIKENIEGEGDDRLARCITKRKDAPNEVETVFSVEDAKQAGLWKKSGTWQSYPERMLKYRARAFNLRDNFADVLMGTRIAEEYEGIEIPAEQATPDVPKREERKAVDAEIKDTNRVLKDELEKCVQVFKAKLIGAGYPDELNAESLMHNFAAFAFYTFGGQTAADWLEPTAYNLNNVAELANVLTLGIPKPLLEELIPQTQTAKKEGEEFFGK